jgi:hypothetical protein
VLSFRRIRHGYCWSGGAALRPVIAGLLLAFPAIFPGSATLIEKHEKEEKEKNGMSAAVRGRQAASVDAAGSAMGSLSLVVFWHDSLAVVTVHPGLSLELLPLRAVLLLFVWQIRKRTRISRKRMHPASPRSWLMP